MVLGKVGMLLLKLIIYNIIKEKHMLENLIKEILYCAENQNIMKKYPVFITQGGSPFSTLVILYIYYK